MSSIILNQTIVMLLLMLTGVVCSKTGIIKNETDKDLSRFVLQVVNPVMIFMSYQAEMKTELVRNLLVTFAASICVYIVMVVAAYILVPKKENRETEIERFSVIYSNCGFMGIPLVKAMFDMEGVFYLTAFITIFNLVVWTHGIILISGEKDFKQVAKVFYSPTIISIVLGMICFFTQIKLPEILTTALNFIGELNTPMAMIVSGVTMAGTNVPKLIKNPNIYRVCALKLFVIPAILAVGLSLVPLDEKVRLIVLVAASAPPAAMCTLQCLRYGKNSVYSSEIFTAGTILAVIALPIVVKLTEFLTKNIASLC